jgi:hypothetical protein
MSNDNGPPKKEVGPDAINVKADIEAATTPAIDSQKSSRCYDRLAGNRRRREDSRRSAPTSVCGCIRDPDVDRHRCGTELSDVMVDAAAAALEHLQHLGTPGLLDRSTCQALWRRRGYRSLAVDCATRAGWAA